MYEQRIRMTKLSATWDGVDLASTFRLEALGEDRFRSVHSDKNARGEILGGQYLGHAMSAALSTAAGRTPHAMSGFFLKGAQANLPVEIFALDSPTTVGGTGLNRGSLFDRSGNLIASVMQESLVRRAASP